MGVLLLMLRARFSFSSAAVLILDGRASCVKGTVSQKILADFTEIAGVMAVSRGLIMIYPRRSSGELHFSGDITRRAMQRFRNVWFSRSKRIMMRS